MNTLELLNSGELKGETKIKLSCNLKDFPVELFQLVDTLEMMDLSNNQISSLPEEFNKFKKLKVAFFSENKFTEFPEVLGKCDSLEMIGFKTNEISSIPENSIPTNVRWLILTNNLIEVLPHSIGKCYNLQKLMLSGNKLRNLPNEMRNCRNIELIRISANNIFELPHWLFLLPRLSWLAFAANPCTEIFFNTKKIKSFLWSEIEIIERLGEGASGIIYKGKIKEEYVAIKIFKGEITSDGLPYSEMQACEASGNHSNLISVIGEISGHPQNKMGLVFELISSDFKSLGNPPSLKTCTRDTFDDTSVFNKEELIKIIRGLASSLTHLHNIGIMHGDVYAHNVLINKNSEPLLGDFGAATIYDKNSTQVEFIEKVDVRGFGCLLEDVLQRTEFELKDKLLENELYNMVLNCLNPEISNRPTFSNLLNRINTLC